MEKTVLLFLSGMLLFNALEQAAGDVNQDLVMAAWAGDSRKVEELLGKGADPNGLGQSPSGRVGPALLYAVWRDMPQESRTEIVRMLIRAGANTNASARWGSNGSAWIVLHTAIAGMHLETVDLLIQGGADSNKPDDEGTTPLMRAVDVGSDEMALRLIRAGCNVNARDAMKKTALHMAAARSSSAMAMLLMDAGADVDASDSSGITPLFPAVQAGLTDVIARMLKSGARVNARDDVGRTALMLAAQKGSSDVVKLLLDSGADAKATDMAGQSALSLAQRRQREEVVKLLTAAGAAR